KAPLRQLPLTNRSLFSSMDGVPPNTMKQDLETFSVCYASKLVCGFLISMATARTVVKSLQKHSRVVSAGIMWPIFNSRKNIVGLPIDPLDGKLMGRLRIDLRFCF